jgi:hypothetical protein
MIVDRSCNNQQVRQSPTSSVERDAVVPPNKPSWVNAPINATHLGYTYDGVWRWFDDSSYRCNDVRWLEEGIPATVYKHWKDSIERRPKGSLPKTETHYTCAHTGKLFEFVAVSSLEESKVIVLRDMDTSNIALVDACDFYSANYLVRQEV